MGVDLHGPGRALAVAAELDAALRLGALLRERAQHLDGVGEPAELLDEIGDVANGHAAETSRPNSQRSARQRASRSRPRRVSA
jgi:hypothetical protein